jgi:dipeptidyl aminopeptidase/acylaminoacyl peptidase
VYSGGMKQQPSLFRGLTGLALLLLSSAPIPGIAEEPRFPNSEDLRHVKAIAGPQLSPDGTEVLFTVTDATADGAKSHLWMVAASGSAARQLTFSPAADKRGEHNAVWWPDGSAIFFVAKRGENTQLFRLPLAGGEASPYELKVLPAVDESKEPGFIPPAKPDAKKDDEKPEPIAINVSGFAISPDGHWLAVWASDPETPGEKKAKDAKADAVWVNHEHHGARLYLAALKADEELDGALKPVALDPDVHGVSWSPKSDRMIVVTEPPNEASDLGPAASAWLVATGALDKPLALKGTPATVRPGFGWSPDGNQVVFAAQTPEDAPPGEAELFALALPGASSSEKTEPLRVTAGFLGSVGLSEPVYLPDGKLLASVGKGTRTTGLKLTLDGKTAPDEVALGTPVISGLSTNRKQTGWVWLASGSDHPESLCYAAALGAECKTLPTPELATQHFRSVKSQLVTWKNDGLTIEGLLYLPPEAATKKVPLIVDVHGGPHGAWEDRYDGVERLPGGAWMGGFAAQSARIERVWGEICRGQQERPGRRRLPRHHGGRGLRTCPVSHRPGQAGADGLQLRRRDGRLCRGQDGPLQGDHQRRAGDRPVQRIRHRGRILVRPLVLRQAVGAF